MKNVDTTIESPAIISICTGSRGLERGLAAAIDREPRVVAYVEIEAFIVQNLVAEMEQGQLAPAPIFTDLTAFDGLPFRGRVLGIVGGYPCQGESNAGKRQLWDDPRFLFPHIERLIQSAQPLFCFFENVSGHLTGSFVYVLDSLRQLGYRVEAGLYAAEEVGGIQRESIVIGTDRILECDLYRRIPHQRLRIFIFAVKLEHAQRDGYLAATLRPRGAASDRHQPQGPQTTGHPARTGGPHGDGVVSTELDNAHSEQWRPERQRTHSDGRELPRQEARDQSGRADQELEHTESGRTGRLREPTGTREGHGPSGGSGILRETPELANGNGERQPYCQPCQQPTEGGQHAQRHPATGGDEELAYGESVRIQGNRPQRQQEPRPHAGEGISLRNGGGFAVARPGSPQHHWEQPRAVESGMGCTVDGYNFREDLLRMYGNGVVAQCAQLAYTELYAKLFATTEA